jgi:hypothetical protein
MFAIDPRHQPRALADTFARFGRLHLPDFLALGSAQTLYTALADRVAWNRAFNAGGRHIDSPLELYQAQDPGVLAQLDQVVLEAATHGFQYRFDSYKVSDAVISGQAADPVLKAAYDLVNGLEFLTLVRQLTGDDRVRFCDLQATRYRPGDFLTAHSDLMDGKNRLYAYVLNLTPNWIADWGGLLAFLDQDGHVAEAYTPRFNALNIFRVPQNHCVTYVAPFAGAPRLSLTGWIRHGTPE